MIKVCIERSVYMGIYKKKKCPYQFMVLVAFILFFKSKNVHLRETKGLLDDKAAWKHLWLKGVARSSKTPSVPVQCNLARLSDPGPRTGCRGCVCIVPTKMVHSQGWKRTDIWWCTHCELTLVPTRELNDTPSFQRKKCSYFVEFLKKTPTSQLNFLQLLFYFHTRPHSAP